MSAREIRAHLCEVRAAPRETGGGITFSGYAAKFNRWSHDLGGFREQILPGAFAESIGRDDVRCLLNHDANHVLGRTKSGTLRLSEDETGLAFEVNAPDVGWVRDLAESVRRGDIDQCSFSFDAEDQEWNLAQPGTRDPDERTIRRARLYDVTIATYPAYEDTNASVRSADEARKEARRLSADRSRRKMERRKREMKLKEREI